MTIRQLLYAISFSIVIAICGLSAGVFNIPDSYAISVVVSKVFGAAVDNTPAAIVACDGTYQLVDDGTYIDPNAGIEANGLYGFTIDPFLQVGFLGTQLSGATSARLEKLDLTTLTSTLGTTFLGADPKPALTINTTRQAIYYSYNESAGVARIQKADYAMAVGASATIANTYGSSLMPLTQDGTNTYFTVATVLVFPAGDYRLVKFDQDTAIISSISLTNSSNTVGAATLDVDAAGTTVYVGHCFSGGGACNPGIDRSSVAPFTFLSTLSGLTSLEIAAIAIDDSDGSIYQTNDATTSELYKRDSAGTILGTVQDFTKLYGPRGSIAVDYLNDKIYWAFGNSSNQLVVKRINRTSFTVEQTATFNNFNMLQTQIGNSMQLDHVHQRLYVARNNGTAPEVKRIRLCSTL